jgi:DNA repair protein RadA/Sms
MARAKTHYVCQQCGATSPGYLGKCPGCGSWQTMVETRESREATASRPVSSQSATPIKLSDVGSTESDRLPVSIEELDRVLGGGIVPGSLVLIGGDPGIGKSTLVLQAAAALSRSGRRVLYTSGEESTQQLKLRANRLGVDSDEILVLPETDMSEILAAADRADPSLLIVDSIQTASVDELESAAGSVSQVRECTARLMEWAKPRNVPVFIIGHVTKEGALAGPRVLEHMVDAVLYLEGERFQQFRILRAVKNRFGSTDEVGVFEMAEEGLREVRNPSEAFLEERSRNAAGSTVAVTVEGQRPILIELQALTSPSVYGLPKRSANGLDAGRLQLLVAVLQKRAGLELGSHDVYANVVGGLRIVEPAADLALALAIASSFRDSRIDDQTVAIGEIGLSGELRSVGQLERRLSEAYRLGFTRAIVPVALGRRGSRFGEGMELVRVATIGEAIHASLA